MGGMSGPLSRITGTYFASQIARGNFKEAFSSEVVKDTTGFNLLRDPDFGVERAPGIPGRVKPDPIITSSTQQAADAAEKKRKLKLRSARSTIEGSSVASSPLFNNLGNIKL